MTRDDDEAGGTTTTFAARRPGRAGLRRRPACAGPRVRVLSGSLWRRRQRLLLSTRPPRVPTQAERRRKLPGPRRARRTSQHPALLANPPTRMQRMRPQRATEWFWRKCEDIQERYRIVSPVDHPHGAAPAAVTSAGELCSGQCPRRWWPLSRSNSTATTLRFLPCRLDPSPAVHEIDGFQR